MFTGLVEKVGRLADVRHSGDRWELTVLHSPWDTPLVAGESVAVQGACLTVVGPQAEQYSCHVLDETFARTNLASKATGAPLNLERALRFGDRLGGHLVAGHIDGVGHVDALQAEGRDRVLRVRCDSALTEEIVLKGSVALDGVSLTVTAVHEDTFEVHIIPTTWTETTLAGLSVGSSLNIETDLLGKFVRKQMQTAKKGPGVSWDDLARAGFM